MSRNNPIFIRLIGIIILGFVALALASCASSRPCIPITDTITIPTNQHYNRDSVYIYQHDSVLIAGRNDTVFVDRWHTQVREKVVQSTDTIYQIKPFEVVREVKHVPKFYKGCAWALAGIVMLGVGKIVWKIVRK